MDETRVDLTEEPARHAGADGPAGGPDDAARGARHSPPPAPAGDGVEELPLTVIERQPGWRLIPMGELWRYRELLYFLTWRDIKVRYKQTLLGVTWAVMQPFATMVVFSLFFGRLAELRSAGGHYPLFVFAGLLPWTFFANAVSSASQSVVGSEKLVTKVYFPRLIIPMGAVVAAFVDFAIAFVVLLGMMLFYGVPLGWGLVLWVPLLTLALALTAFGVGALLAALSVAYRDVRHALPFLVQLWMFATPTIYMNTYPELNPRWKFFLPLNPVYGLIRNFRAAALGHPDFDVYSLVVSCVCGLVFLLFGCLYFRRVERHFADII